MKIREPLNGFNISLGYIVIQIGFFIQGLVFLISYTSLESAYTSIIQVVLGCYGLCIVTEVASWVIMGTKYQNRNHIFEIANYIYIFSSSFVIFYILTRDSTIARAYNDFSCAYYRQIYYAVNNGTVYDIDSQLVEIGDVIYYILWIIVNYAFTVFFAIVFLLLQTCLPIHEKHKRADYYMFNEENDDFDKPNLQKSMTTNIQQEDDKYEDDDRGEKNIKDNIDIENMDLIEGVRPTFQRLFLKNGIAVPISFIAAYIASGYDAHVVNSYIAEGILSFALFAIDCYDIFSPRCLPKAVIIAKFGLKAGLYGVASFLFIYYFTLSNSYNIFSWAWLYFYILVVDLFISLFGFRRMRKEGISFLQFLGLVPIAKVPLQIKYERNVELTDDIFCIAYNANYKLSLRRQQIKRRSTTTPGDPNQYLDTKDEEENASNVVTNKLAASLFGKSILVFTAQVLMISFVFQSFQKESSAIDQALSDNNSTIDPYDILDDITDYKVQASIPEYTINQYESYEDDPYSEFNQTYQDILDSLGIPDYYQYGYDFTEDYEYDKCILNKTLNETLAAENNAKSTSTLVAAASFQILMIRLLCAIFLHIQVLEEMVQGLKMFYFAKNQVSDLAMRNTMIAASLMKFLSSLFAEIVNIFLISSENLCLDIIKDFVALTIIAELDSIYAKMISKKEKGEEIEEGKELEYDETIEAEVKTSRLYFVWNVIYVIQEKFFYSFVFYFLPFATVYLNLIQILVEIFGEHEE